VSPEAWDACAGPGQSVPAPCLPQGVGRFPTRSGARAGWLPQHLAITDENRRAVGPRRRLYVKSHSPGRIRFRLGAGPKAYERAGGRYYPKLPGRGAVHAGAGAAAAGADRLRHGDAARGRWSTPCARSPSSRASLRCMSRSVGRTRLHRWRRAGFLHRIGVQYHWANQDYGSFADFLGALASRKRKSDPQGTRGDT